MITDHATVQLASSHAIVDILLDLSVMVCCVSYSKYLLYQSRDYFLIAVITNHNLFFWTVTYQRPLSSLSPELCWRHGSAVMVLRSDLHRSCQKTCGTSCQGAGSSTPCDWPVVCWHPLHHVCSCHWSCDGAQGLQQYTILLVTSNLSRIHINWNKISFHHKRIPLWLSC